MKKWPVLNYGSAKESYLTLHLFTQIVGKIKLDKMPWINHSWHVVLFVTPYGLSTNDIPDGDKNFQIDFSFIDHQLKIVTSEGEYVSFGLQGLSVADFYNKIFKSLNYLGINVIINDRPNELEAPVLFPDDYIHATYDTAHIQTLHRALLSTQNALLDFRSGFRGKSSSVQFFWGSFDLAVSCFSGRQAPVHPGGIVNLPDHVVKEAYSHEVFNCGFWPGNEVVPYAAFYAYIYPEPEQFDRIEGLPEGAFYHEQLREYILPYDKVKDNPEPEKTLYDFYRTTYEAASDFAGWDKKALEFSLHAVPEMESR